MANLVSCLRVLLGFLTVGLLFIESAGIYWTAFFLTIAVIWMDGLDGYLARKLNESSKFGAVLDILGDRIVELTYWIAFAVLGWVGLWIPLLVMARGILVDGFRAMALEQGFTAFGSSSMMQSKLGVFLVSSRASRWLYAVTKAVAFALLVLAHLPGGLPEPWPPIVWNVAYISTYVAVFFCLVRGLPVLIESRRFF